MPVTLISSNAPRGRADRLPGVAAGWRADHRQRADFRRSLRAARRAATDEAKIMIVAPALHRWPLRFWLSDADEAIQRAELVQHETVEGRNDAGSDARGDTGERDPIQAVEDILVTFPAQRIALSTTVEPSSVTTRESTPTHRSNGLACRSSEPSKKPGPVRPEPYCWPSVVSRR
jgi:hypothetical protein